MGLVGGTHSPQTRGTLEQLNENGNFKEERQQRSKGKEEKEEVGDEVEERVAAHVSLPPGTAGKVRKVTLESSLVNTGSYRSYGTSARFLAPFAIITSWFLYCRVLHPAVCSY